ncbi:MAG: phosphatase PAP2 family protein [Saprospiraceae bacterium]
MDQSLFHLLNAVWTNDFFDVIIPFWRNKYFWLPLYSFILFFIFYNYKQKAYWFIICLIACVGSADLLSSKIVKEYVQRVRPCNNESINDVRNLVHCGSGYSFTSNHSANHFAISFFLLLTLANQFKKLKWPLILWAISIAYSQVYVGVHFPLDVISGAILGVLTARLFVWLYCMVDEGIPEFCSS